MSNSNDYNMNNMLIGLNREDITPLLNSSKEQGYALQLITPLTPEGPYIFKSLGFQNIDYDRNNPQYIFGSDFPTGNTYQLIVGKFPLKNERF